MWFFSNICSLTKSWQTRGKHNSSPALVSLRHVTMSKMWIQSADSKYKLILAPASICNDHFLIQKEQNKLFIVTWTARQWWILPTLMQFLPRKKKDRWLYPHKHSNPHFHYDSLRRLPAFAIISEPMATLSIGTTAQGSWLCFHNCCLNLFSIMAILLSSVAY